MTFRALPAQHRGNLWTTIVAGWVVLLLVVVFLTQQPFSLPVYLGWLAVLAALVAWGIATYRAVALMRLQYTVDRDALRVRWGWSTFVVPMSEIREVYRPGRLSDIPAPPWWRWPALHVWARAEGERVWYMFGTRDVSNLWFFCGPGFCVGISPTDGEALLKEVNRRRALGANRRLTLGWEHPRVARWRFWQDTYALLGWLAGFVFLAFLWGEAARRAELPTPRRLAELGTLLLAVDWLLGLAFYRRERLASLILWWTGGGMLAVLLIGLWTSRI